MFLSLLETRSGHLLLALSICISITSFTVQSWAAPSLLQCMSKVHLRASKQAAVMCRTLVNHADPFLSLFVLETWEEVVF